MDTGRRPAAFLFLLLWATVASGVAAGQGSTASPRELHDRAVARLARGDHVAALALLWEAARLAPEDARIQSRLGEALERMGALDAAIEAYDRALGAQPGLRAAANRLVVTLVTAGRGAEARRRAEAMVAAAPADPAAHFTLGLALAEQDVDGALRAFRRALELAPDHALARYNLALVLKRIDRTDEAIGELRRVLRTASRPEAHYTLGVIYWQRGDYSRAAAALRDAIAADPGYADAHYTLGAVLSAAGDADGAASALRRALELRPDLTGAHYTLARVLESSGDQAGARAHRAEAERLRRRAQLQQEASVWTSTGIRKLEAGDAIGAIDHFRRATTIDAEYAPAHYQMGLAFARVGQREASRAAFARAQALNPSLIPPDDLP